MKTLEAPNYAHRIQQAVHGKVCFLEVLLGFFGILRLKKIGSDISSLPTA